jgi:hypothetical protein
VTCGACNERMDCVESRRDGSRCVRRYRCPACGAERFTADVEMDPDDGRRAIRILRKIERVRRG